MKARFRPFVPAASQKASEIVLEFSDRLLTEALVYGNVRQCYGEPPISIGELSERLLELRESVGVPIRIVGTRLIRIGKLCRMLMKAPRGRWVQDGKPANLLNGLILCGDNSPPELKC